jgi:hypothetical protein
MQQRGRGDGQPLASGGSSPDSSFPKGSAVSARPAFGDRTSVAVAVALMVALTLLFLPWSTIRPGLSGGGGGAGSGVGAAPSGPGSALNAHAGSPSIGVMAIAQPLAVTQAGTGSGPTGPTRKHNHGLPVNPVAKVPTSHTGHKHRDPGWPDGHQNDGNGDDGHGDHGHEGDGGNGGKGNGNGGQGNGNGGKGNGNGGQGNGNGGQGNGNGGQGNGNGGQGNGNGGGWGGGHHQSGQHQGGNHGHGGWGPDASRHRNHGNGAVLILA